MDDRGVLPACSRGRRKIVGLQRHTRCIQGCVIAEAFAGRILVFDEEAERDVQNMAPAPPPHLAVGESPPAVYGGGRTP